MDELTISIDEMINYIHKKCKESISKDTIAMILDFQEDFLESKGLIALEEDELY